MLRDEQTNVFNIKSTLVKNFDDVSLSYDVTVQLIGLFLSVCVCVCVCVCMCVSMCVCMYEYV
jgi:hypothetical protein